MPLLISDYGAHAIAALGKHSYADQAAREFGEYFADKLGRDVEIMNFPDIRQASLELKNSVACIAPVENSGSGFVTRHWKLWKRLEQNRSIGVIADTYWMVRMRLCGVPGMDFDNVNTVFSHPQAIDQCDRALGKSDVSTCATGETTPVKNAGRLSNIRIHQCASSTVAAIEDVLKTNDRTRAVLCSPETAEAFKLRCSEMPVTNLPDEENVTQMFLLQEKLRRRNELNPDVPYHALFVTIKNRPGALKDLIGPIADSGTDMTALHTKPMKSDQRFTRCIVQMNTTNASQRSVLKMPGKIENSFFRSKPLWQSWSDRLHPPGRSEESKRQKIDWESLHRVVIEDNQPRAGHELGFVLSLTPVQRTGVLSDLLACIEHDKSNVVIRAFDSATLGLQRYTFRLHVVAKDKDSMKNVLYRLQGLPGQLLAASLEPAKILEKKK